MSNQMSKLAWNIKGLPLRDKIVLLALADIANEKNNFACYPTNKTLAERVEMSIRTVQRIVASLERRGLISRQADLTPGKSQGPNRYIFHFDAEEDEKVVPFKRAGFGMAG